MYGILDNPIMNESTRKSAKTLFMLNVSKTITINIIDINISNVPLEDIISEIYKDGGAS